MNSAMQRLNFVVSMVDRVSGPMGKVMKSMDKMTTDIQSGYRKIGYGAAGLFSVGYAFNSMLEPAKEMRTALGTISSLGVENAALENLRKTSMTTAVQYGSDATEIVAASYKLQSAISGLKGNELSMLTNKSAMLATATKGGLESTNAYVGQMFNIHAAEANAIGNTAFMDKLISKTAKSVQLFNTDGDQMAEAMKNIGKQATAMKVPLEEQLAVMGFLQNTMIQGGKSGTAYSAFLSNISNAEGVLGMKFTDSQNKALPMVDIITKLESKFGDLSKAGDQELLQKAFGKQGQRVLSAMAGSLDTFQGNLESIQSVNGLDDIAAMAMAITDPWDKSSAAVKNFRMEFGQRLLKAFAPVYNQITNTMSTLTRWMNMFPNLTNLVVKATIVVGGLIATISLLSVAVGVSKFIMVGWFGGAKVLSLGLTLMRFSFLTALPAVWSFSAALLASPITWIVLGIVALVGAVVAAIVYWDVWTVKLKEWGATFFEFIGSLSFVGGVIEKWNVLANWWSWFKNWIGSLDVFAFVGDSIDWLIDKLNMIPGIDINGGEQPKPIAPVAGLSNTPSPMAGGGVMNQISNATSNSNRTIGDVYVQNYGSPMSGQTLNDELAFAAS